MTWAKASSLYIDENRYLRRCFYYNKDIDPRDMTLDICHSRTNRTKNAKGAIYFGLAKSGTSPRIPTSRSHYTPYLNMLKGSCMCGGVKFEITSEPLGTVSPSKRAGKTNRRHVLILFYRLSVTVSRVINTPVPTVVLIYSLRLRRYIHF